MSAGARELLGDARVHKVALKDALELHGGIAFTYTPHPDAPTKCNSGLVRCVRIPVTGVYSVLAAGARAPNAQHMRGGYGVVAEATFLLQEGDVLELLCGAMGEVAGKGQRERAAAAGAPKGAGGHGGGNALPSSNFSSNFSSLASAHESCIGAGGGGGTFVALNSRRNPLLVAGGGGGSVGTRDAAPGLDASVRPDGHPGTFGTLKHFVQAGRGGRQGLGGWGAPDGGGDGGGGYYGESVAGGYNARALLPPAAVERCVQLVPIIFAHSIFAHRDLHGR